jgi:surfeit locus 1 family protein
MTVATIATIALTISLGNWQARRAQEKIDRQRLIDERAKASVAVIGAQPVDPSALQWRAVRVEGRFMSELTILLDNRVLRNQAGYHVYTPLAPIDGGPPVMVSRGWIAQGPSRAQSPAIITPTANVAIEGRAILWTDRVFELKNDAAEAPRGQRPVWQNVTQDRFSAATVLTLQPVILQQSSPLEDGLVREWPSPTSGIDKHRMYSMQWYSFAALALVLYVVLNLKRGGAR